MAAMPDHTAAQAGMFFWCQFYLQDHPDFAAMKSDSSLSKPSESLMAKIWMQLTQANVSARQQSGCAESI